MAGDEKRTYTQEQVNAILRRALDQQSPSIDGLSHDELVATAREVGIEPAALNAAIQAEQHEGSQKQLERKWRDRRKAAMRATIGSWAAVNTLLFAINVLAGGPWWFLWAAVPWGVIVFFTAIAMRRDPTPEEIARLGEREERRAHRRELRMRYRRGAEVVGRLVEEGASALISHLDERAQRRLGPSAPQSRLPGRDDGGDEDRRKDPRQK